MASSPAASSRRWPGCSPRAGTGLAPPAAAAAACSAHSGTVAPPWSSSTPRKAAVPARRPTAGCRSLKGRADVVRAGLPRRLLGPPGLERPLRQPGLHPAPGAAAARQRRPLRLHAAGGGRRRRPPDWPAPAGHGPPAPVAVQLSRDGSRATRPAWCAARARPTRLAAYWAVTEHGHVSAREGRRERRRDLAHDPWCASTARGGLDGRTRRAPTTLRFDPATGRPGARAPGQPGDRRRRQRPAGAGGQARLLA